MHYYSFHPGDYLKDTAHLTNEEDLAYRRLLDFYHQSEAPIPAETQTVSRRLRVGFEVVNQVLSEFFELREDGWHQARCDAAIADYQRKCDVNREVGKLGGRPKKTQTVSSGNPDGTQTKPSRNPNHKPITNNHKPENKNHRVDHPGFEEFWNRYPRREAKAKALESWNKEKPNIEQVIEALQWQRKIWNDPKFIPMPTTYLNQRRFEDEPIQTPKPKELRLVL